MGEVAFSQENDGEGFRRNKVAPKVTERASLQKLRGLKNLRFFVNLLTVIICRDTIDLINLLLIKKG